MAMSGRASVVGGAVTGRVLDGRGLPKAGVWVYAHPFQGARFGDGVGVHTGPDGAWQLELAPGRWQVREAGADPVDVTVTEEAPAAAATDLASTSTVVRLAARRAGLPAEDAGTSMQASPPEPAPASELGSWAPSAAVAARRAAFERRQEQ